MCGKSPSYEERTKRFNALITEVLKTSYELSKPKNEVLDLGIFETGQF